MCYQSIFDPTIGADDGTIKVASHTDAWIETIEKNAPIFAPTLVASYAGAWKIDPKRKHS